MVLDFQQWPWGQDNLLAGLLAIFSLWYGADPALYFVIFKAPGDSVVVIGAAGGVGQLTTAKLLEVRQAVFTHTNWQGRTKWIALCP